MKRRVLHVVWQLNAGGIAHWLMNVLRHIDRTRYRLDFMVLRDEPCAFKDEIRSLGGEVITCPGHRNPWRFARRFAEMLRAHGPYDVVHSHVYNYSGFILMLAARQAIPVRIAHSHTDIRVEEAGRPLWRRLYLGLTMRWIRQSATARVGVSAGAVESLYGSAWRRDAGVRIIPPGLDFTPFGQPVDRAAVRRSLGLSANDLVIGHVGNYVWAKNHHFLIEVAACLARREPRARLLLIGDGLLNSDIDERVRALNLADRIRLIGPRDDVPRLMIGAMDGFLFPSHYEGFGLVLIEAQAAALPCVVATGVPEETQVIPELIRRLPLSNSPDAWAAAVLEGIARRTIPQSEAYGRMLQSPCHIDKCVAALAEIYETSNEGAVVLRRTEVPDGAH